MGRTTHIQVSCPHFPHWRSGDVVLLSHMAVCYVSLLQPCKPPYPDIPSSQHQKASLLSATTSPPLTYRRKPALNLGLRFQNLQPSPELPATRSQLNREYAFLTPQCLPFSTTVACFNVPEPLLSPILPQPGCLPKALGQYLQQGQVCILSQLLQVLHSRCGLDHTHQGWGAVKRELTQQGLLIAEQQQGMVRAMEQS